MQDTATVIRPQIVICTEERPGTVFLNNAEIQNHDHQVVKPVTECYTCSFQPTCEQYNRSVRERG